jgi:hypothetical protein
MWIFCEENCSCRFCVPYLWRCDRVPWCCGSTLSSFQNSNKILSRVSRRSGTGNSTSGNRWWIRGRSYHLKNIAACVLSRWRRSKDFFSSFHQSWRGTCIIYTQIMAQLLWIGEVTKVASSKHTFASFSLIHITMFTKIRVSRFMAFLHHDVTRLKTLFKILVWALTPAREGGSSIPSPGIFFPTLATYSPLFRHLGGRLCLPLGNGRMGSKIYKIGHPSIIRGDKQNSIRDFFFCLMGAIVGIFWKRKFKPIYWVQSCQLFFRLHVYITCFTA